MFSLAMGAGHFYFIRRVSPVMFLSWFLMLFFTRILQEAKTLHVSSCPATHAPHDMISLACVLCCIFDCFTVFGGSFRFWLIFCSIHTFFSGELAIYRSGKFTMLLI